MVEKKRTSASFKPMITRTSLALQNGDPSTPTVSVLPGTQVLQVLNIARACASIGIDENACVLNANQTLKNPKFRRRDENEDEVTEVLIRLGTGQKGFYRVAEKVLSPAKSLA